MDSKYNTKVILFLFLVTVELFAHNYWLNLSWDTRTALYYLSGFSIAVIPLIKIFPTNTSKHWRSIPIIRLIGFLFLISYGIFILSLLIGESVIDITQADMLPILQIMANRFLDGKDVYAVIPEIWDGIQPIYLPAMWFPYLIASAGEFDMRWINLGILLIGLLMVTVYVPALKKKSWQTILPIIPAFFLLYTFNSKDAQFLLQSEEAVVAAYYLILVYSLHRGNPIMISIALSLCLLSRYSLLIWVVLYLIYLFVYESKKMAIRVTVFTSIIMLFLCWVSGAIYHIPDFLKLPSIYENAMLDSGLRWKYEPLVNQSLGFAKYFGFESMDLLIKLFKAQLILAPTLCLIVFASLKKYLNSKMFIFCSLKFCLILFYGFMIMPYKYLFFTSTLLSIAIFSLMIETDFSSKSNSVKTTKKNNLNGTQ